MVTESISFRRNGCLSTISAQFLVRFQVSFGTSLIQNLLLCLLPPSLAEPAAPFFATQNPGDTARQVSRLVRFGQVPGLVMLYDVRQTADAKSHGWRAAPITFNGLLGQVVSYGDSEHISGRICLLLAGVDRSAGPDSAYRARNRNYQPVCRTQKSPVLAGLASLPRKAVAARERIRSASGVCVQRARSGGKVDGISVACDLSIGVGG